MTTAEHQTHEQLWRELEGYAGMVAAEILEETEDEDERHDAIHEAADGSHYVIYTAEAWDVVNAARHRHHAIHDEATQRLTDMEGDKIGQDETIDNVITRLAFCILETLISRELEEQLEELEEEDADSEDE